MRSHLHGSLKRALYSHFTLPSRLLTMATSAGSSRAGAGDRWRVLASEPPKRDAAGALSRDALTAALPPVREACDDPNNSYDPNQASLAFGLLEAMGRSLDVKDWYQEFARVLRNTSPDPNDADARLPTTRLTLEAVRAEFWHAVSQLHWQGFVKQGSRKDPGKLLLQKLTFVTPA